MSELESAELPVLIREGMPEDEAFIYSSWLKSHRYRFLKHMLRDSVYYPEHHKVIESILKRSRVLVAYNPEDMSHILAYLVAETMPDFWVIHYLFVKEPYRQLGIAKRLILTARPEGQRTIMYTHSTNDAEKILVPKLNAIFNPYWGK